MTESSQSLEMSPADYKEVSRLPGNEVCIDCGDKNTEWGSVSFGILFCAPCSGGHRGLGTHISRVRSVKMDSWSDVQMKRMKQGGNQKYKDFFNKHNTSRNFEARSIRERYDCPAAELYKDVLTARIEGRPEPTALPAAKAAAPAAGGAKKKMEGFGSSPPPPKESSGMKLGAWFRRLNCFRCCLDPDCD